MLALYEISVSHMQYNTLCSYSRFRNEQKVRLLFNDIAVVAVGGDESCFGGT